LINDLAGQLIIETKLIFKTQGVFRQYCWAKLRTVGYMGYHSRPGKKKCQCQVQNKNPQESSIWFSTIFYRTGYRLLSTQIKKIALTRTFLHVLSNQPEESVCIALPQRSHHCLFAKKRLQGFMLSG
jgi:hypothetical protein